jgi:hypothetical protein
MNNKDWKDWEIKMRKIRAQQEKDFLESRNENIIDKAFDSVIKMFWSFNIRLSETLTPDRITHIGLMRSKKVSVVNKGEMTLEEHLYDRKLIFGGKSQFVKSFYIK